jgi:hypothetical protein
MACTQVVHAVSLDTKYIIAWVKENNTKSYVSDHYNEALQPSSDPDCRLDCKQYQNQPPSAKAEGLEFRPSLRSAG